MSDFEQALLTTLNVYSKTLGTRRVVELCQGFILNAAFPSDKDTSPPPVPATLLPTPLPDSNEKVSEASTIKKIAPIKRKPILKLPESTPEAKQQLQSSVSPSPVKKKEKQRNFKKLVEDNVIPIGTELYPSAPDPINPATVAHVVKDPKGNPAIQPSWDKGKYFTGTSSPPVKFLLESQKRFPGLKIYVKENAWNDVLYKGKDGHFRMLSDAQ